MAEFGSLQRALPQKLFRAPQIQKSRNTSFNGILDLGDSISQQLQVVDFENNQISDVTLGSVYTNTLTEGIQDQAKYEDSFSNSSIPKSAEYPVKYQTGEKRSKFDDSRNGEFSERSPNNKVSPAIVIERSPSASFERSRFSRRNTMRRSLEGNDDMLRGGGVSGSLKYVPIY